MRCGFINGAFGTRPVRCLYSVALVLLTITAACTRKAPAPEVTADVAHSEGVVLSAEQIRALGITTERTRSTDYQGNAEGFGVVIGLDTFAQTYADVATASAAAAQSAAALNRARKLAAGEDAAVSQEVLESAANKASADQAALQLAQRKSDTVFGLRAPWHSATDRKRIMDQLARGHAVLIRVTFPLGRLGGTIPDEMAIRRIEPSAFNWHTKVIWPAPADATVPGNGFFVLLEGSDLAQGEHVAASSGVGGHLSGVWIPQTALLLSESGTWAYAETKVGRYQRVGIDIGRPYNGGYVLKANGGIAPGQNIVVTGAGLLLAHELNPSAGAGQ